MGPPDDAHNRELTDDGVKLAFAYFEHVEKQVALATTTAQLTVAATALLINAYVIAVKDYRWNSNIVTESVGFLFVGSGVFLLGGFALALFVAFPNLRTGWKRPDDVRSLFYFKTVASMESPESYMTEFAALDKKSDGLGNEILRQVWGKSFWLNRMFVRAKWAIGSITGGTLLLIAALLLMYGYPVWLTLHQQP
jgi:hypothetical protein